MNYKAIILSTILGISTPAIIDMAIPNQAIAVKKFDYPAGEFTDKDWNVTLGFTNNSYYYYGKTVKVILISVYLVLSLLELNNVKYTLGIIMVQNIK